MFLYVFVHQEDEGGALQSKSTSLLKGTSLKKMTTPSRKLRHTAEASLTVLTSEKGGGVQKLLISMFCNVL